MLLRRSFFVLSLLLLGGTGTTTVEGFCAPKSVSISTTGRGSQGRRLHSSGRLHHVIDMQQSNPTFRTRLGGQSTSSDAATSRTPDDVVDAEIIVDGDASVAASASLFPRRQEPEQHNQPLLRKVRTKLQNFLRVMIMMLRKMGQRCSSWSRGSRKFLAATALAVSLCFTAVQTMESSIHYPPVAVGAGHSNVPSIERVVTQRSPSTAVTATTMPSALAHLPHRLAAKESSSSVAVVRGGSADAATLKTVSNLREVEKATERTLKDAVMDLHNYMVGPKSDTLILLLATALVTPICKRLGTSPILGFLASGMLLGPNGCGFISGIHTTETLAELGIVFFLFEMGIELSVERLMQMRKDVFGLGLGQFSLTALAIGLLGRVFGLPANAQVVLGGGLALSSSAFVLQLLKDKNQLATRFGKASFGILLFQDLAVVPLLVVTPLLAGSGSGMARAVGAAVVKAGMALGSIAVAGRYLLNPLFKLVATAQSQEAFLGLVLLTVLSMSFMTEGLGLSNTLGAFLAGVLLSETKYRYQVEADIAPFRGVLLGLFFVTVGFEIDLTLIAAKLPLVAGLVTGIMLLKAAVTTALSLGFGLSLPNSLQTGLIISQGGEFAFVAFGLARSLGILDPATTKLMLTSVSLTMALTPLMSSVGGTIAKSLEEKTDFTHYLGQDRDASEIKESEDFAVVVGYGAVGKIVCNLLDRKLIKYVGLEVDPNKAIQARNAGLPVFYGDVARQEVADAFNVGKAKMVIVCIADRAQANRALIALRRFYPDVRIFSRAVDADHAARLQNTLNVAAMVPILPEDNLLLTLPFGGAVMKALGISPEEVNAILESKRKEVLQNRGLDEQEEEAALVQLGIISPKKPPPVIAVEPLDAIPTNATSVATEEEEGEDKESEAWDEEWDREEMDKVAAERRMAAMEKSPFVADVIVDICPGIADKPGQNETTAEMFEAEVDVPDSPPSTAKEEFSESTANN